jgi:hypothetical protein
MPVYGYTFLTVGIGKRVCKMKFTITEEIFPNVIIGLKSMKEANIAIIPAWDCLRVGNESVPFISKIRVDLN